LEEQQFKTLAVSSTSGVAIRNTIGVRYEGWNFNSGNYLFTTDTK